MKVQPTPTSPKAKLQTQQEDLHALYREELQNIDRPPARRRMSLVALILAVLFGFAAGIMGEFFSEQYLYEWLNITPPSSATTTTVVPKAKPSKTVTAATLADSAKSVVGLYIQHEGAAAASTAYTASESVGSAVLLSADGWAATSRGVLVEKKTYVAVIRDRTIAQIDERIDDPAIGVTYIHLADVANLSVATIGTSEALAGQEYSVLAAPEQDGKVRVWPAVAQTVMSGTTTLRSSDELSRMYVVAETLPPAFAGGPLVDANGAVLGIVRSDSWQGGSTAWPINYISSVLPGLLRDSQIVRPALGLHFVNLALSAGVSAADAQGKKSGALVTGTKDAPAVAKKSAAEKAGIRSGDIITTVGAQVINGGEDLADVLSGFTAGQTVDVTVVRKKEEMKLKVTLGSASASAP